MSKVQELALDCQLLRKRPPTYNRLSKRAMRYARVWLEFEMISADLHDITYLYDLHVRTSLITPLSIGNERRPSCAPR